MKTFGPLIKEWFKNLVAKKTLIAIVPIVLTITEEGDRNSNSYTAYCYLQGNKRKACLVGPLAYKRCIKNEHERWTHCIEPWLKFGYTTNLQEFMVGDYGTTSLDQPKSC